MTHNFFIILAFLFCISTHAQDLSALITPQMRSHPSKSASILQQEHPISIKDKAINYFLLGKCYAFQNREDIALQYFANAKSLFHKAGRITEEQDATLEAYILISSQEHYDQSGKTLLDDYYAFAKKEKSPLRLARALSEIAKNTYHQFIPKNREK